MNPFFYYVYHIQSKGDTEEEQKKLICRSRDHVFNFLFTNLNNLILISLGSSFKRNNLRRRKCIYVCIYKRNEILHND